MSRLPQCPVCRQPDAPFYGSGRDRLFRLSPASYALYRCGSCRCIFQHPMPEESVLEDFYPRDYWWNEPRGNGGGLGGFVSRLERFYRETVVRDHVRFLRRCARGVAQPSLLDIGCGSGTFLAAARKCGFASCGMDVSEHAVSAARAQYRLDVRQGGIGSALWQERFDFVTMFHVLEHVRDPLGALQYGSALLKRAGKLIVQVPNASSIQARLFGPRWYGLDVPRHLINFTPAGLELLLSQAGLKVQAVSRFSLRDNPAALASSIATPIDPIGRRGRRCDAGRPAFRALLEFAYLGLFGAALPLALLESAAGRGATLWVAAQRTADGPPEPVANIGQTR